MSDTECKKLEIESKSSQNKEYYQKNKDIIAKYNLLKRYEANCNVSIRKLKEYGLIHLVDKVAERRSKQCEKDGCDEFAYTREAIIKELDKFKNEYKGAQGLTNVKLNLNYLIDSMKGPENDVFKPLKDAKKFEYFCSNIVKKKGGTVTTADKNSVASSLFSCLMNNRTNLHKYFKKKDIEHFTKVRMQFAAEMNDERATKKETQVLNFSMNEFDKFRDKILKKDPTSVQALLLSLYSFRPPLRDDYKDVQITNNETSYNTRTQMKRKKINHFNIDSGVFYLNDYKTDKIYQSQEIDFYGKENLITYLENGKEDKRTTGFINYPKLESIIKKFHKGKDYKYLLGDEKIKGSIMDVMRLPDSFGVNTFSNIRSAYITRFYTDEFGNKEVGPHMHKQKRVLSKFMLHSKEVADAIYNKESSFLLQNKEKKNNQKLSDRQLINAFDQIEAKGKNRIQAYRDSKKLFKETVKAGNPDYEARVNEIMKLFNYDNREEMEKIVLK